MPARTFRRAAAALMLLTAAFGTQAIDSHAPQPALIAPRAVASLLLDVVRAGDAWIVVGERGHLLRSEDGSTWTQVPAPVRATLTAAHFVDARHGWAVGHDAVILATRDGGRTWALQHHQPERGTPLLDVLFVDARHGWAVGNFGLFLETVDGGTTWTAVETPVVADDELTLHAITRLGNGDLLLVGERGRVIRSTDGGRTWKRWRAPDSLTLFGAAAVGPRGVLICGLRGTAWLREDLDRGDWQPIATGTAQALYGCAVTGRDTATLVGAAGTVLRVDLAGRRSQPLRGAAGGDGSAVVAGPDGLIVVGERGVQRIATGAPK